MIESNISQDDALLDALARGEPVTGDDEVASMLGAWRDDVRTGGPDQRWTGASVRYLRDPAMVSARPGDSSGAAVVSVAGDPRQTRSSTVRLVIGLAAAVVGLAGLVVAAGNAGPGSPLWPITRLVYHDRAESRTTAAAAERIIAEARQAVVDGRFADAGRLLDEATMLIGHIDDLGQARYLHAQVAEVNLLLHQMVTPPASAPSGQTAGPPSTSTPGRTEDAPGDGGTGTPGGSEPTSPGLPLPNLPPPTATLPSLPVPTLLPDAE